MTTEMTITPVQSSTADTTASATRSLDQQLNKHSFLQLLITQLQSQDPLKPMSDREFVAELAQFSSLEQMQQTNQALQQLGDSMRLSAATGYLGRTITAQEASDGTTVVGKVSAVTVLDGQPHLVVGAALIAPDAVSRVE
ncbi:MAG TPA: flagellar hook capping FlgD N-terminal domain-containing protein [Armatimonadota bacterium]|nr:flagellar hook capping FlgD N-terminal domain-containing protein [Armatimonadota bacterium]HOS42115.1 flagellar hook capping FlgD N-terminal domain-containing protein [Armatimonadota bacterium]